MIDADAPSETAMTSSDTHGVADQAFPPGCRAHMTDPLKRPKEARLFAVHSLFSSQLATGTCPFGGRLLADRGVKVAESMMASFVGPCEPFGGPIRGLSLPVFAIALGLGAIVAPAKSPAADIQVVVDHAKLINLPEKVATIVIGNPMIADATLQAGGLTIITGKSYGSTNFIALDRGGAVLMETMIRVGASSADTVVVYRGVNRETYSCAPSCEPRIMLGDGQPHFGAATAQATAHSNFAQGGNAAQGGARPK